MAKYIDADEFVRLKREWYCEECEKRKGMKRGRLQFVYEIGGAPCRACDVDDVISDIEDFPDADVEPVKHGKWIKSPECPEEYDICSVCGLNDKHRTRADQEHPAFESLPFYCKWCGAKMDKEEYHENQA